MDRRTLHTNETAINLWRLVTPSRLISLVARQCERFAQMGSTARKPAPTTAITYLAA